MKLSHVTPVPNPLFDHHLKSLSESEIKVLLIVIRQTWGWIDPQTRKRKQWDWITISQFQKKTGLSNKSVSKAIALLVKKNMVVTCDSTGYVLTSPEERKHAKRIFYGLGKGLFIALPTIRV